MSVNRFLLDNWKKLSDNCFAQKNEVSQTAFNQLVRLYSQSHRHYHDLWHIERMLQSLQPYTQIDGFLLLELATWFHDAFYEPMRNDNEAKSAQLAAQILSRSDLDAQSISTVQHLIMITANHIHVKKDPLTLLEQLMLDADLMILGCTADEYNQYSQGVRAEFSVVPAFVYKPKRKAILQKFLSMPRIYRHPDFFDRYEQQARINIANEIAQL